MPMQGRGDGVLVAVRPAVNSSSRPSTGARKAGQNTLYTAGRSASSSRLELNA